VLQVIRKFADLQENVATSQVDTDDDVDDVSQNLSDVDETSALTDDTQGNICH